MVASASLMGVGMSPLRRCAPAVAMAPHLDSSAALGCFVALAPIILSLQWGLELNRAQDRLLCCREVCHDARLAILCGEGCSVEYEQALANLEEAQLEMEEARPLRLAGATQVLLEPYTAALRVRLAPLGRSDPAARPFGAVSSRRRLSSPVKASMPQAPAEDSAPQPRRGSLLPEKVTAWETSEEEFRAKTRGGNLPLMGMPAMPAAHKDRLKVDGFGVGMGISLAILLPLSLMLFTAPFWMDSVDLSALSPPPMP